LERANIYSIEPDYRGHTRFCFLTRNVDELGAPEILAIEVVPGKPTEIKVYLCGVIDIVKAKQ
jgi:hypothetical protein